MFVKLEQLNNYRIKLQLYFSHTRIKLRWWVGDADNDILH